LIQGKAAVARTDLNAQHRGAPRNEEVNMLATAYGTALEKLPDGHVVGTGVAKSVSSEVLGANLQGVTSRIIDTRQHLFHAGEAATHIYKVEIGSLCIYRTTPDGRRQVIDFAYPGDLVGLGALGDHATNAQALTTSRVTCIPLNALQHAVELDGALGLRMCEALSRELLATRELVFTVTQRPAVERVAAFLLAISRRNEQHGEDAREFVLPMTRNDIADFLGLTIETVSRAFSQLRREGVIELTQSILVKVADLARLSRFAANAPT
jgi:CRP/FNR family transcriptional regulator